MGPLGEAQAKQLKRGKYQDDPWFQQLTCLLYAFVYLFYFFDPYPHKVGEGVSLFA